MPPSQLRYSRPWRSRPESLYFCSKLVGRNVVSLFLYVFCLFLLWSVFLYLYLCICISVSVFLYLFFCICISVSVFLYLFYWSVFCICISVSVSMYLYMYFCICIYVPVFLNLYFCIPGIGAALSVKIFSSMTQQTCISRNIHQFSWPRHTE